MAAGARRKSAQPIVAPKSGARRKHAATPQESSAAATLIALTKLGGTTAAAFAQQFFKTEAGQYGAGDLFLGIRVPLLCVLTRDMKDAGFDVAAPLLKSGWHEARAVALMLLVRVFQQGDEKTQKRVYALYLKSSRFINNWDLVDMSAEHIVGPWLADKPQLRKFVVLGWIGVEDNSTCRSPIDVPFSVFCARQARQCLCLSLIGGIKVPHTHAIMRGSFPPSHETHAHENQTISHSPGHPKNPRRRRGRGDKK